jgi:predicted RNA-binding protein YlxR (DUF448 family)
MVLDPGGRTAGRGAYLCADGACWALALKRGSLQHALHAPLPPELQARLASGDLDLKTIEGGQRGS